VQPLGRHHARIRRLRALRRDAALRQAEGHFVAEGYHLAAEALAASAPIELALVTPRVFEHEEGRALVERLARRGVELCSTSDSVMDGLQDARSAQPLLLSMPLRPVTLEAVLQASAGAALILVACGVQDPGNLGALLRSTEAAWGTGLIAVEGGADLHHPRAVRASAGSIFRLPACRSRLDLVLAALRDRGVQRLAADGNLGTEHTRSDLRASIALFLGSEGAGLDAAIRERLDGAVRIATRPEVQSLSVGAAAAVVLFEAARQRAVRD